MDWMERFLKIYEVNIQWWLAFYWLLDDISQYENLLSSSPTWSETCLFLSKIRLYSGSYSVNHNSPHDLADNWQQRNSTPVFTFLIQISFFQQFDNQPFPPFSWCLLVSPHYVYYFLDLSGSIINVSFKQLCLYVVYSWCCSILQMPYGLPYMYFSSAGFSCINFFYFIRDMTNILPQERVI